MCLSGSAQGSDNLCKFVNAFNWCNCILLFGQSLASVPLYTIVPMEQLNMPESWVTLSWTI